MSTESPDAGNGTHASSTDASNTSPDPQETAPVESPASGTEAAANANSPGGESTGEPAKWKPRIVVGTRYSQGTAPGGGAASAGRPAGGDRPQGSRPEGSRPEGSRPEGSRHQGSRPQGSGQRPRQGTPRGTREEPAAEETKKDDQSEGLFAPDSPRGNIPVPSKRGGTSPELEAELAAAMGDVSLDQIVAERVTGRAVQEIEPETKVHGTVMRIAGDNVFLSLGGRNEGVASVRQFKEPPAIGSELEVVVKSFHADDGLYELLVPGASVSVSDWADLTQGGIVEARITGANTGGLECMVNHIRGFIPASQIGLFRVENFADYINQKLLCVVTEANPKRKNLVLSHRAVMEREREESRQQLLSQLEAGQTYEGVVRSIQDFGVFVDLGGVDGLIHISQLSWDRVQHPSEVVHEGQRVKVKIERVNPQTGKISLSYRDLLDRPWDSIQDKISVGSTVKGPVSRVAKFGAFVKLAPGVEGLIHISELAHGRVRRVEDVLHEGQEVEVKILSIDPEAQRIALSLKATLPPPEAAAEAEDDRAEPARPLSVPKQNRPLRGGLERPSGGDHFGLNW